MSYTKSLLEDTRHADYCNHDDRDSEFQQHMMEEGRVPEVKETPKQNTDFDQLASDFVGCAKEALADYARAIDQTDSNNRMMVFGQLIGLRQSVGVLSRQALRNRDYAKREQMQGLYAEIDAVINQAYNVRDKIAA